VPTTLAGAKKIQKTRATPFLLRILVLIFQITHHQSSQALTNVDGEVVVDDDVDDDVRNYPHPQDLHIRYHPIPWRNHLKPATLRQPQDEI